MPPPEPPAPPRLDDVQRIVDLVAASSIDELILEFGAFKLVLRKDAAGAAAAVPRAAQHETPAPAEAGPGDAPPPRPAPAPSGDVPAGAVAIRAPVVGTFYRAAAPGAPPFVELGGRVEPDDTVCIVEVMKLMNEIRAGCRGRVAEIRAENGALVEYGQVLVVIEPMA